MRIVNLTTVDGFVAFDLDCPNSGGGTRLAPDVTAGEAALLARAMTYKLAVLERHMGGAKAALRAGDQDRDEVLARYCREIEPMVASGEFLTASDLGTRTEDFASLPGFDPNSVLHKEIGGELLETIVTGNGVVVAADTALSGLAGRRVAIEGFGKVGGAAAREAARRGARVVALSTVYGCVVDEAGLDIERITELRLTHGDRWVEHAGPPVRPALALYEVDTDVLVPGARTGMLDEALATRVRAEVISPAANVPYTAAGLRVLRERGVVALADFVCNAGATIGYVTEAAGEPLDADGLRTGVDDAIARLTEASMSHPSGPFAGACQLAEEFLHTWRDPNGMPEGPPLAG